MCHILLLLLLLLLAVEVEVEVEVAGEVEVEVGPDVNPEPEGGKIDPAYFNSSPAYKRKVRRHTSSRFGNVPKGVLDAENSLSAVSCKGASLQDRLGFVSMFAKVGPGQSCAAW